MTNHKNIGILIFPGVEILDFCGPFEVFSITRLDESKRLEEPSPFNALLVAEHTQMVETAGGMKVMPEHDLRTCPPLHLLLVPGGHGVRQAMENPELVTWIRRRGSRADAVASVCTGAFLLAMAGLLDEKRATTHWAYLDEIEERFHRVKVERDQRVVIDGNVFTSAGVSAGIDLALTLVARWCGETVARATARRMEYPYPESNVRVVDTAVEGAEPDQEEPEIES